MDDLLDLSLEPDFGPALSSLQTGHQGWPAVQQPVMFSDGKVNPHENFLATGHDLPVDASFSSPLAAVAPIQQVFSPKVGKPDDTADYDLLRGAYGGLHSHKNVSVEQFPGDSAKESFTSANYNVGILHDLNFLEDQSGGNVGAAANFSPHIQSHQDITHNSSVSDVTPTLGLSGNSAGFLPLTEDIDFISNYGQQQSITEPTNLLNILQPSGDSNMSRSRESSLPSQPQATAPSLGQFSSDYDLPHSGPINYPPVRLPSPQNESIKSESSFTPISAEFNDQPSSLTAPTNCRGEFNNPLLVAKNIDSAKPVDHHLHKHEALPYELEPEPRIEEDLLGHVFYTQPVVPDINGTSDKQTASTSSANGQALFSNRVNTISNELLSPQPDLIESNATIIHPQANDLLDGITNYPSYIPTGNGNMATFSDVGNESVSGSQYSSLPPDIVPEPELQFNRSIAQPSDTINGAESYSFFTNETAVQERSNTEAEFNSLLASNGYLMPEPTVRPFTDSNLTNGANSDNSINQASSSYTAQESVTMSSSYDSFTKPKQPTVDSFTALHNMGVSQPHRNSLLEQNGILPGSEVEDMGWDIGASPTTGAESVLADLGLDDEITVDTSIRAHENVEHIDELAPGEMRPDERVTGFAHSDYPEYTEQSTLHIGE